MHTALPQTANESTLYLQDNAKPSSVENNKAMQALDLESRIALAQLELNKLEITSQNQLNVPSIIRQVNGIKSSFNLGKDIEVHMHGKKAEFCAGHDHDKKALHKAPVEKKTSTCTGDHCKAAPEKPKGFFQNLFSTAA